MGIEVSEEVVYEDRFADGGATGSGPEAINPEQSDESGEVAKAKTLKTPAAPSSVEREAHESTHMPYRSWCLTPHQTHMGKKIR